MKIRNIFLILFLLLTSFVYSFDSESRSLETSSEVEYSHEAIVLDGTMIIENYEIAPFNKVFILGKELKNLDEVLIVLKHPNSSVIFSHSLERPLLGYHNNLKEILFCCRTDRFIKVV